ncbi:NAD(P)H-dependent oxidoreductase subunit E [Methylomonas sp. LL1]|uniref:(2Fe-2S) ferredoxin domain-containing protein n=1 Tax=Methylomonas sp. LL1 TaxID=2785785 RepID=UPI0018C36D00|nr:NAD(P)H-dependent oxidoreductase subunit E [Methylomonas sp. LL1]QPK65090.1 NAD(P)H-dependent oxidoreductase subunit E [Methylomonas sp. LL1]
MSDIAKPTMAAYDRYVLVCAGKNCTHHGEGPALYEELKTKLKQLGLTEGKIVIKRGKVHCFGVCTAGPLLCVQPDGVWYYAVDSERLDKIIDMHLIGGQPVTEWVFHQGPRCHA